LTARSTRRLSRSAPTAGEKISISSISSARADSLGVGTTSSYSATTAGTVSNGVLAAGGITVNGYGIGPSIGDGVSAAGSNDSAISKAAAFNAVSGSTGVTAKASATTLTGAANTAQVAIAGDATDNIYVNNVKLGNIAAGANAVTQGANIAAAFNAVSNQSGVTATFSTTTGAVSLSAADGRNISLIANGTGATLANTGLTMGAGGNIAAAAAPTTVHGPGRWRPDDQWLRRRRRSCRHRRLDARYQRRQRHQCADQQDRSHRCRRRHAQA
jgi:flagellin